MEQGIYDRKKEITELQKLLSDSHLAIYNEKNAVNGLRLKFEDLRKTQRDDERRLKELKSLSAEVNAKAKTTKLTANSVMQDRRPEKNKVMHPLSKRERAMASESKDTVGPFSTRTGSIEHNLSRTHGPSSALSISGTITSAKKIAVNSNTSVTKMTNKTRDTDRSYDSKSSLSMNSTGGIVKTVILPFDEINNIKIELEYLKQYKNAQKALYEETIDGYHKDKIIRTQEFNLKEIDMLKTIANLQERYDIREEEAQVISKDYFEYKRHVNRRKEQQAEERERLLAER